MNRVTGENYNGTDSCTVVHIIEKLAKKYDLSCTLLCDTNHIL